MKINKEFGNHSVNIAVYIEKMTDFKVNCANKASDPPIPREFHAACSTSDQILWVYGGLHPQ
jgi:hypothetical protein